MGNVGSSVIFHLNKLRVDIFLIILFHSDYSLCVEQQEVVTVDQVVLLEGEAVIAVRGGGHCGSGGPQGFSTGGLL